VCTTDGATPLVIVRGFTYWACQQCQCAFLDGVDEQSQTAHHTDPDYRQGRIAAERAHSRHNEWLVRALLRHRRAGKALDVGCGAGYFVKAMSVAGFDATGVDLGRENVQFAGSALGVRVLDENFLEMEEEQDIITMHQLLEHVPSPMTFLSKALQLLRPGGLLMLSTPNLALARRLARLPAPILGDALGHPPSHCTLFAPPTISYMLERSGFRVREISNNPTGLKARSRLRHAVDALVTALGVIGPNMVAFAERSSASSQDIPAGVSCDGPLR